MRYIASLLALLGFAFAAPGFAAEPTTPAEFDAAYQRIVDNADGLDEAARLHALFDLDWRYRMIEHPESATYHGYPGQNDRWTDVSAEAIERRRQETHRPLKAVNSIDPANLSETDRLSYELFKRNAELNVEGLRFPDEYLAVNQLEGVHLEVPNIIDIMPAKTVDDYRNIIARLRGASKLIEQHIALLRRGLEAGITLPKTTLAGVGGQVSSLIVDDPMTSPMLRPFKEYPDSIGESERQKLTKEAATVLQYEVLPAYKDFGRFIERTYEPRALRPIGRSELPDGAAWYAHRVKRSTTTDLSPPQIHEIGMKEVRRIRREMDDLIAESGFRGTFDQFTHFLRTDERFFFNDPRDLLMAYRDIAKRADPELIKLFKTIPRMPYGVIAVPEYEQKSRTTAYYRPGSPEAGRAGYFFANTYDLRARPSWMMEALTLHEAVPGHHFQIAIAQELQALPEFRRYGHYTAYVEGWGLYAESLGLEMGFYKDPYANFGRLNFEMWRAIRLVIDTGVHSMGWSRDRAINFFRANSAQPEHDIAVEVDRYIAWPGQALAYKIGELKFKELRARVEKALGARFDIRAFHDRLLDAGPLPLDVLEKRIDAWIAAQKEAGKTTTSR